MAYENKIFVGFADGNVVAFSVDDGVIIWERKVSTGSKFIDVDMTPVRVGENLLVGSASGPVELLKLETGERIKKLDVQSSRTPLVWGESIYIGSSDGKVVRLNRYFEIEESRTLQLDGSITSVKRWKEYLAASTSKGRFYLLKPGSLEVVFSKHLGSSASSVLSEIKVEENKLAIYSSRNRLYVFH